eukprot:scaffold4204_cov140-Cylindrotheca_fusiformis.AAC.3
MARETRNSLAVVSKKRLAFPTSTVYGAIDQKKKEREQKTKQNGKAICYFSRAVGRNAVEDLI